MTDISEFQYVFSILVWVSLAELAIQVAISDLSEAVKGAMLLNQPYNAKLNLLCSKAFWCKLLGKGWWVATPITFLFKIHRFFSELLSCPWCCGFWMALFTNHFYLNFDWITSIILAPMVLVFVTILDKIHSH